MKQAKAEKLFFVADVHLNGCKEKEAVFISFLKMVLAQKGTLYILGDLFDYWTNNSIVRKKNALVLKTFKDMRNSGINIYFLEGNRDFLMSAKLFAKWGVEMLEDEHFFSSGGEKVYLTHGHILCTNNKAFLEYQKKYWPMFRFLDKVLPGFAANWLASLSMKKSKSVIKKASPEILLIPEEAVLKRFALGASKVICGHTHTKKHTVFDNGSFYTLPPWDKTGGGYGLISDGIFCFKDFF